MQKCCRNIVVTRHSYNPADPNYDPADDYYGKIITGANVGISMRLARQHRR